MRIQSGVLVSLGYGKYVRSDRVSAVMPIEEERGPGRRTFVFVESQKEPLVASRAEDSLVRDLVREPREVTRARQQQEILRDLLEDLSTVNDTAAKSCGIAAASTSTSPSVASVMPLRKQQIKLGVG
ncbi:MAG: hypothetical protein JO316_25340 [Abitibacteriaceae bacterium]|nr:hypothetical protein [Abditibacteriaceae bacterium]MBV9868695.1 hypothetical protein [Abditibacteriaceae bacterium]